MAANTRTNWDDTPLHRLGAALLSALVLLLLARVLLHLPQPQAQAERMRLQLRFIPRAPVPDVAEPVTAPDTPPPVLAAGGDRPRPAPPAPREARPAPPAREDRMAAQLYERDGRARLPAESAVDPLDPGATAPPGATNERELRRAAQVMERPNPIDYKPTVFDKDWSTDGTLGDVAMQGIGRGMKKINKIIFGPEIQSARARPPPDVRYNPALHERASDLGSEATGDAYKAAPIAYEKAPGHDGEASARIRKALSEWQAQAAGCDAARVQALLAPVRTHLADLERVEHAYAKGADPVMAEQMLPRQADSAYDLARRALWYAREQTQNCR